MTGRNDLYFAILNEIGIIAQLSRSMLEARLPGDLIAPHFTVLNHLIRVGDGPTPLDLARAFQVPKTSMTHTLMGLEKLGCVEMRPNPSDGRSKCVWLTAKGRAFRDDAVAAIRPDLAVIAADFPAAKAEALLPDLERLRRLLDEKRNQSGQVPVH